jgi:hypothetical protein
MNAQAQSCDSIDNGGRRAGIDRRSYSYFHYIPERRSGEDRRSGTDRRYEASKGYEEDRRSSYF